MQLINIKISNLLSYPYQHDLSSYGGITFHNKNTNDVNVLIGPNGSGKSGFLHIFRQIFKIAILNDFIYDRQNITTDKQKVIAMNEQYTQGLRPHFSTPDKPSQVLVQFDLNQYDYDNMCYITKHANILNKLISVYSTLDFTYPVFSDEEIRAIPSAFVLECAFDIKSQKVVIDQTSFSQYENFVLLYLQTIELIQIFIDIYNDLERGKNGEPLVPLTNCIGMIGIDRSLKHVPNRIDPHSWNNFIGDKQSSQYHSYIGYYLCAKKIRNIISDHSTLKMSDKDISDYPQKLAQSKFYTSLISAIKKYFNKTLRIEYSDNMLDFILIDEFGCRVMFAELSDGEQSLLSMIFTMYGYDLRQGLLMIDEPEIHFHPQMQRSFSRMMEKMSQSMDTQFIISTYSPLFINELNIGSVYKISKINGATEIKNPFLNLSSDEATLVHLLKFENMSKMFFVNNIIMVEGETDAYFFDFYLKYLHTLPERKAKLTDYEIININGKGSYKVRSTFLSKFGLNSFFIGDWDNIVDYGFMSQSDLAYYYKQARSHYTGLKKSGKTHRHYNRLVDTIRNMFPQQYRRLIVNIDELYKKNVFILKKGDIETYLDMPEKGLENMVKFCHYDFKTRLENPKSDAFRQEFENIFSNIFT